MTAFYNEIDPYAAQWLRNLIAAGHIAPGVVDERDIRDIRPSELAGYRQCHFFAGIGGWSRALRLAGIRDDEPIWTGSCPCQPFSAAGAGGGFADERHLWPHWFHLVRECKPAKIYGEQVASKNALHWFDLVRADLENEGYAVGVADLCAAGFGAPHIRQRLWFVADSEVIGGRAGLCDCGSRKLRRVEFADGRHPGRVATCVGLADADGQRFGTSGQCGAQRKDAEQCGCAGELGDAFQSRLEGQPGHGDRATGREIEARPIAATGDAGGVAEPNEIERRRRPTNAEGKFDRTSTERDQGNSEFAGSSVRSISRESEPDALNGFWRAADWLLCRDGKWRPVEPGSFPLAHGVPARVGRLRAYGNAISPEAGAEFVRATL